ncbi:MAG: bifunctional nuclease domain-containing protein [Chitinophagales bacterium]|nr:bifunctional nuclease domain-containing protein [Chitinophagales bacterium]
MDKIELEIVALSHSIAQSHSYAVVLGEIKGLRRLPIVIGGPEAQAIAVALEKMNPSRPLTHDLIRNLFTGFDIELREIVISNLKDGIFYAHLICQKGNDIYEIDSRTSDALALAVRFNCPIYTYEFILDQAGIVMEEDSSRSESEAVSSNTEHDVPVASASGSNDLTKMNLNELNELLGSLLDKEDYEKAIKVRDEISRRKGESQ